MSQSGASIAVSRPQQIVWAVAVFILNFAVGICWILARYSLSEISRRDSSILSIIYGAALIGTVEIMDLGFTKKIDVSRSVKLEMRAALSAASN